MAQQLCGNGSLPSLDDVVELSAESLAASAQRHWDGTGTVSRFPSLSGKTRGLGAVHYRNDLGQSFVTAVMPSGAADGQSLEQFPLNPDGTLATLTSNKLLTTPLFPASVQVGRHGFLVGGYLTDAVERLNSDMGSPDAPVPQMQNAGRSNVARSLPAATVEGCVVFVNGGYTNNAAAPTLGTEVLRVTADGNASPVDAGFGPLPVMRDGHAAVFHAGSLTVVGGFESGVGVASAVRLELDGGVIPLDAGLSTPRGGMANVPLADGRVLLLGGSRVSDSNNLPGGSIYGANRADSEVVDVRSGSVVTTLGPALLSPRAQVAAALTPRGIVVVGGCGREGQECMGSPQDTLEWIPAGSTALGAWTDGGIMLSAREGPVVVYHRDRLYLGGGTDESALAWEWRQRIGNGFGASQDGPVPQSTPIPQRGACAYQNGGTVWLLGGAKQGTDLQVVMQAEPVSCNLDNDPPTCAPGDEAAPMREPRAWHTCVVHENSLYVVGGVRSDGAPAGVEVWSLTAAGNLGTPMQSVGMPVLSAPQAHGVWDGDTLVVSGTGPAGSPTATRVVFPADGGAPGLDMASPTGGSALPRRGAAAVRVGPMVLFAGGSDSNGMPSDAVNLLPVRQTPQAFQHPNDLLVPVAYARAAWAGPRTLCLFGGTQASPSTWPRPAVNTVQCTHVSP